MSTMQIRFWDNEQTPECWTDWEDIPERGHGGGKIKSWELPRSALVVASAFPFQTRVKPEVCDVPMPNAHFKCERKHGHTNPHETKHDDGFVQWSTSPVRQWVEAER